MSKAFYARQDAHTLANVTRVLAFSSKSRLLLSVT